MGQRLLMAPKHITVFVLHSVHSPTDAEMKAVKFAILERGQQQGFEPWGITSIRGGEDAEVVDRVVYEKWYKNG